MDNLQQHHAWGGGIWEENTYFTLSCPLSLEDLEREQHVLGIDDASPVRELAPASAMRNTHKATLCGASDRSGFSSDVEKNG